jgi:hypothetical protein
MLGQLLICNTYPPEKNIDLNLAVGGRANTVSPWGGSLHSSDITAEHLPLFKLATVSKVNETWALMYGLNAPYCLVRACGCAIYAVALCSLIKIMGLRRFDVF